MCIIDEVGNSAHVLRWNGVADGIQSITSSAQVTTPNMNGSSMAALDVGINAALTNNPSIDTIVTLIADTVLRTMQVVQSRGLGASVAIATFDLNAAILTANNQNKVFLAVDQQGFLQTFATVQLLKVYHMTGGMRLATQVLLSGPLLVNSGNVKRKQCQIDPTQTGCTVVLPSPSLARWRLCTSTAPTSDTSLFDLQALSSQVSTLIKQGISALVLPVPSIASGQDYTSLIDAAAAANIPVITWSTGMVRGAARVQLGKAAMHLGQNETLSGLQVGLQLNALIPAGAQYAGIQTALTNGRSVAPAGIVSSSAPLQQLVLAISVCNAEQSTVIIRQALAAYPQVSAIVYPTAEAARTVLNAVSAGRTMVMAGYGLNLDVNLLLETGPLIVNATNVAQYACLADTSRDPSTECPACPTLCSINGVCLELVECACKSGWLLGPNLDCQDKDPGLQFIASNSGVGIAFSLLAALGIAHLAREGVTNVVCAGRNEAMGDEFQGALITYNVLLILYGAVLGFLTLGAVMYNLTVLAVISILLSLTSADNVKLSFSIHSLLIFLGPMSTNGHFLRPRSSPTSTETARPRRPATALVAAVADGGSTEPSSLSVTGTD
ncbi:hypothetical protein GGF31_003064 [Allomyces arbusculus]|nr:hypothetical protein GGF31_003064 [Allomyces arbusculus]